jgi:hypothetical protein
VLEKKMKKIFGLLGLLTTLSSPINAAQIDFTGGTAFFNGNGSGVTNNSNSFTNVSYYEEAGFKLEFVFESTPSAFSTIVGDYYRTGNDVLHAHWGGNDKQSRHFGEVDEIRISKIDGSTFDLGGFRVSTNTAKGGGQSDGNELTWVNSSKGNEIFSVTPDSWGLGAGNDPLITIAPNNRLFDDILWFSFTNDELSSAVGLGLDNFFLDEAGDLNGSNPSVVPIPAAIWLFGSGLVGLMGVRKKSSKISA